MDIMLLLNLIPAYFLNRYWERRSEADLFRQNAQLISKYKANPTIKHSYYKQSHFIKDFLWEWNKATAESILVSILKQDRVLSKLNIVPYTEAIKNGNNYFLIECPLENVQEVVIKFRIIESSETTPSILRINWLMSVFNVLPYVWYDENGDPYVLSYGGAAIPAF